MERVEPRGEQGQALLEFVFVVVFLILILFGIIDFGRLFFSYASMSNGAREGARYGITHPDDLVEIENRARGMLEVLGETATVTINYPGTDAQSLTCTDPSTCCTDPVYCRIQVEVQATLDVWTPVLPNLNLVARSTMHFE